MRKIITPSAQSETRSVRAKGNTKLGAARPGMCERIFGFAARTAGRCRPNNFGATSDFVARVRKGGEAKLKVEARKMVTQNLLDSVSQALGELSPAMVVDGGGVELVSVEDKNVTLRLIGSCEFCPSRELSSNALKTGLKTRVPELSEINIIVGEQRAPKSFAAVRQSLLN